MAKDVLGEFEHQVMLAALRLADRSYTAAIVLELEARTQREVAPAAVYIALRRLEENGLVTSKLQEGAKAGALRERRFFTLTRTGLAMLRTSRQRYLSLWEGLEPIFESKP